MDGSYQVPPATGVYVMSMAERDRLLQQEFQAEIMSGHSRVTRPSGEPVRSDQGHANGWHPRQQAAMRRLLWLWQKSLPERVQPQGYPSQVCQPYSPKGEDCRTQQEVDEALSAYSEYKSAMDCVEHHCSKRHADVLRMTVQGEPTRLGTEHLVREALWKLSDLWAKPRNP